ncbi:MAG: hypothetical protein Kow00121_45970 [Elainellaceae cyanobacterium]
MSLFERTNRIIRAEINYDRREKSYKDYIDPGQALRETGIDLKQSINNALSVQQELKSELQRMMRQAETLITKARYEKYHGSINQARAYLLEKNEILKQSVMLSKQIEQYEITLATLRESLTKIENRVGEIPEQQSSSEELESR